MTTCPRRSLNALIAEVFRLNGAIAAAGDRIAAPFGLSSARWQVLGAIATGGAGTVSDLSRRIGVTRQSAQRVVGDLEREGFVELVDNPGHRRARLVALSGRGREAHAAVDAAWSPTAERIGAAFGSVRIEALVEALGQLRPAFRDLADKDASTRRVDQGSIDDG